MNLGLQTSLTPKFMPNSRCLNSYKKYSHIPAKIPRKITAAIPSRIFPMWAPLSMCCMPEPARMLQGL